MQNKNILNEIWFALIWEAAYLTFILWTHFEFEIGSHNFPGIAANLSDSPPAPIQTAAQRRMISKRYHVT